MLNQVLMIGRVGRKPEAKDSKNGNKYSQFSIVVDSFGAGQKKSQWIDITVFGKTAENCAEYLDKGSIVAVEGSLQIDEYEKDKVKHKKAYILGSRVTFISSKQSGQNQSKTDDVIPTQPEGESFGGDVVDDIPF